MSVVTPEDITDFFLKIHIFTTMELRHVVALGGHPQAHALYLRLRIQARIHGQANLVVVPLSS